MSPSAEAATESPLSITSTSAVTTEIMDKISLPANIGDILKSIKNVTAASTSTKVQKMDVEPDEEYVPTSLQISNYEYKSCSTMTYPASSISVPPAFSSILPGVPSVAVIDPMTMDIDERMFPPMPILPSVVASSSSDSKLGKMSQEELIKLIPDEVRQQDPTSM